MRFLEFRVWLKGLVETLQPDVIVYEQAHHRGGSATELCVGLTTRIQEVAAECGAEYRACHTATLKAWATGKGTASKEEMMKVAGELLKREPVDDNESDAVLLLAWAEAGFPEHKPIKKAKKKTVA